MKWQQVGRWRYLIALWAAGSIALATVTWACLRLDLGIATTGFIYLTVIVVLSLMDSLISSIVFSLIAVGCLDFFFIPPLFRLDIDYEHNISALIALVVSSVAITGLMRRVRRSVEMERRQARLLDLTHDAVFVCDTSDKIIYWNRGAEELYGWTREEALGKGPSQLLQSELPDSLEAIKADLARIGRWDGEIVHTKRDGSKVWVASRWSLQRDEGGRPLGTLESNNDITERKRAEDALHRSQAAYLAEAQRLSHTGSFDWNVATGALFWSEETYRILEYDPASKPTVGMVLQRWHPDDVPLFRQVTQRAISNREALDFEHRLLMPDGSVKTVHVVAHPVNGASSEPRFIGAMMDVTARTEAYAALEQSEQRYRHLFHNMPVALVQLGNRGHLMRYLRAERVTDLDAYVDDHPEFLSYAMEVFSVEAANERAVKMFGARDANQLMSLSAAYFWQERPDTFRRTMLSRFRGEPIYQEETKVRTFDGRVVDVLFTVARPEPVTTDLGGILYGFVDITEKVRTQEKLQQLQAEFAHAARISVLGELAASIAHEVNQPLTALAANGEAGLRWLNRPEPNLAEAIEAMRSIVADSRRAGDIILRIRAMAARRVPRRVVLSLHDVIDEALLFVRHELQSKNVAVSLDLAPSLPPVLADRTQLQQVIVNLAINAVQAMNQAGTAHRIISISTAPAEAGGLTFTLEDSGPGIAPEHLNRLFESFFTTKESGMGMGLAICRSIIEGYGGKLRAETGSAYGGARFSFTLPATQAPTPSAGAGGGPPAA